MLQGSRTGDCGGAWSTLRVADVCGSLFDCFSRSVVVVDPFLSFPFTVFLSLVFLPPTRLLSYSNLLPLDRKQDVEQDQGRTRMMKVRSRLKVGVEDRKGTQHLDPSVWTLNILQSATPSCVGPGRAEPR